MQFRFNFDKALQSAVVLLKHDGNRMGRIRLLKLLYIAERELLAETARPLTGDRAMAMQHGPVLSHVYDLIKGEALRAGEWDRHIRSDGHAVELREDPSPGKLSRREIEKLGEVSDRYRNIDDWELSEATHEFDEWIRNYSAGSSTPIPWQDVFIAQGREELVEIAEREESGAVVSGRSFWSLVVRAGDTFFIGGVADRHLWVVISDPKADSAKVVFVSMTSFDITKEDVCIVEAGEHTFVKHRTCIAYHDARHARLDDLLALQAAGRILPQQSVSLELLKRIRRGASLSRDIPVEVLELLLDQGVLD